VNVDPDHEEHRVTTLREELGNGRRRQGFLWTAPRVIGSTVARRTLKESRAPCPS